MSEQQHRKAVVREREFMRSVLTFAKLRGWRTAHFDASVRVIRGGAGYRYVGDTGAAGFPDIVLVRGTRVIFAELKADGGTISKNQVEWLEALRDTGRVEVYVWRPKTYDEMMEALA